MKEIKKSLRYNENKPHWSLVDFKSLEPMVRVLEYGAHKYSIFQDEHGNEIKGSEISPEEASKLVCTYSGRDNWKLGFNGLEPLESAFRHLIAMMSGEELDPESNLPHSGHLMCNIMFWNYHQNKQNEKS